MRAITTHIVRDDPTADLHFTQRLLDNAQALNRAPYRSVHVRQRPGVRRIVHRPCLIYHRIEEDWNIIRVLRFWHGARNSKTLRLDG